MGDKENKENWKRMSFKGNKVWAFTGESDVPAVEKGKVLIKYQLTQEHEYWVHERSVLPVDAASKKEGKNRKYEKSNKKKAVGPKPAFKPEVIPESAICLYTDGASSGNPGPSGIGVLLRFDGKEKTISRYIGEATNNIAELEAIRVGLLELKRQDLPVRVFTDSSYAYGVLTQGWKAKKNIELIQSIRELMTDFADIQMIKVKGHAGFEENERADVLATSAIKNKEYN